MDAKHTKTSWDLVPQTDGSSILARMHEDKSKGFRIVAHILLRKDSQIEDSANAAFIKHAVNAHDDLVKACERLLIDITTDGGRIGICNKYGEKVWRESVAIARAALAKARGE